MVKVIRKQISEGKKLQLIYDSLNLTYKAAQSGNTLENWNGTKAEANKILEICNLQEEIDYIEIQFMPHQWTNIQDKPIDEKTGRGHIKVIITDDLYKQIKQAVEGEG